MKTKRRKYRGRKKGENGMKGTNELMTEGRTDGRGEIKRVKKGVEKERRKRKARRESMGTMTLKEIKKERRK